MIFFDRRGNYKNYKFTGIDINAIIRIPSSLKYTESDEGYYILRNEQMPTISVELRSDTFEECILEIPFYLAYYKEKKILQKQSTYDVFSKCDVLKIKVPQKRKTSPESQSEMLSETQVITSVSMIDGGLSEDDNEALGLANSVMSLLALQTKLPFDDELRSNFSSLNRLSHRVKDQRVRYRIEDAIAAYREKQNELEKNAELAAQRAKAEMEEKAQKEAAKLKAEQDSIATVQKQEAEKQQKRNIWMIIGGIFLAIALFVGNQVSQTFRNKSAQKNMEELARRAEEKAKREARQKINSRISNAKSDARRKARQMVNDGVKSVRSGKIKKDGKGIKI